MDRISDYGSEDGGSSPPMGTNKKVLAEWLNAEAETSDTWSIHGFESHTLLMEVARGGRGAGFENQ